jgi:hypothetical protein
MTVLAGGMAYPLLAEAQQKAMPVIGWLSGASAGSYAPFAAAFRQGLSDAGYVEGQSVAIDYRWANGESDRLAALAADLVRRKVDVIAAFSLPAALAAKSATSTIPLVFVTGEDPVANGLVGPATDPVRAGRESQHRQGARPDGPPIDPRPRRRGHRVRLADGRFGSTADQDARLDLASPLVCYEPAATYERASDEHGRLAVSTATNRFGLADKIRLIPGLCDPTVNLYDWYVCVRGNRVEQVWPITARGAVY